MAKNLAKCLRVRLARKEIEHVASTPVKLKEQPELETEMKGIWKQLMGNENRDKAFYRYCTKKL